MKTTMLNTAFSQPAIFIDEDAFNICATIFVVAMVMVFILSIIKRILAYRLKKEIIERGIPDSLANSLFKDEKTGDDSLKWCFIFIGLGIGLGIVHYTPPLGLHSLAILCISTAAGFFSNFLYHKNKT